MGGAWIELVFSNLAILAILLGLEKEWEFRNESHKRITCEDVELIRPENYNLLMADLQELLAPFFRKVEHIPA